MNKRLPRNRDIAHFVIFWSFVCLAILFGIILSRVLFASEDTVRLGSKGLKISYRPHDLSGYHFAGLGSISTKSHFDSPYLSLIFWLKPSSSGSEEDMIIVGNREISCSKDIRNSGFGVYYSKSSETINVIWRSRNSPCETLSSPLRIHPNRWTHIAVVFTPFEPDVDVNEISEGAYPAMVNLYINGMLVASKSQVRFFSEKFQTISLGGTPTDKSLLKGRVFMLMVMGQPIEPVDIKRIYEGDKIAGALYNKAEIAFGYGQE